VIYRFDTFLLDTRTLELREGDTLVPIQRKVFDVLAYLVAHRDRVVWKDELLQEVWRNETVVESAVHRAVSLLRRSLRQSEKSSPLETIYGRGYRFRAQVTEQEEPHEPASSATQPTGTHAPLADPEAVDPFVGRTEVLRPLLQGLRQASRSEGAMFLLMGEAGIGKTRTAERVWREAERHGARLWKAQGSDISGAPAAWPWIQILRSCLAELSDHPELLERGHQLAAALAPQRPGATEIGPPDKLAATAKFRLFDQLSSFLLDACCVVPHSFHVLWIDDLSPENLDSFHILNLLGTAVYRVPLFVMVALKSDAKTARRLLLDRVPDTMHRILLPPLSKAEVSEYISRVTELEDPALLTERIFDKTEGSPVFMRELLRHLITTYEREHLSEELVGELPLPAAVHELVDRHLQDMDAELAAVLEAAAVVGKEFRMPALERCAPLAGSELLAALDRGVNAGLLRLDPSTRTYRFAHGIFRDALYRSLDTERAAQLHLRVAESLEGHVADTAELCSLAYHYLRALPTANARKALRYAVEATGAMLRMGAFSDAARYSRWALEAQDYLDTLDPGRRCELLGLAAASEHAAGNAAAARELAGVLVELGSRYQLGVHLARAGYILRPVAIAHMTEPDPLARRALELARDTLPKDEHSRRSRVLSRLSWIPPYSQDRDLRLSLSEEAASLTKPNSKVSRFDALIAKQLACSAPRDSQRARETTLELLAEVQPTPVSVQAVKAHLLSVHTFLRLGETDVAARDLRQLGSVARELHLDALIWTHDRLDLQACFYEADVERLEQGIPELYTRGQELKIRFASHFMRVLVSAVDRLHSDPAPRSISLSPDLRPISHRPIIEQARCAREIAEGPHPAAAKAHLARLARSKFQDLPEDGVLLATLAELALTIVSLRTTEHAQDLLDQLAAYRDLVAIDEASLSLGSVAYYAGLLRGLLRDTRGAFEDLEVALEANRRLGHLPQEARTRLEIARLRMQSSDPQSRTEAARLLEQLQLDARRMRLTSIEKQAEQLVEAYR